MSLLIFFGIYYRFIKYLSKYLIKTVNTFGNKQTNSKLHVFLSIKNTIKQIGEIKASLFEEWLRKRNFQNDNFVTQPCG